MSPESEGGVEYLGAVTTDGALDAQLQLLAVDVVDLLQVGQHLLTHGVLEHQETPRLRTLVVFTLGTRGKHCTGPEVAVDSSTYYAINTRNINEPLTMP